MGNKTKLLITGSAGFLGANLIRYLLFNSTKYEIVGIDKLKDVSYIHNVYMNKANEFYLADTCNKDICKMIFEITKPNVVIHFASKNVDDILYNNIIGFKNIIDLSQKYEVERIIYISTTKLYYSPGALEVKNEDSIVCPSNEFLVSKQCCENLLFISGLHFNIIRAPEIFGPRQHHGKIVEMFLDIKGNGKICLNNHGSNQYDILHVEDFSAATLNVIESGIQNEIYNVSINSDYTELELASLIRETLREGQIEFVDNDIYEPFYDAKINASKIRNIGWKPIKGLKERIKNTTMWFQNNPWIFR